MADHEITYAERLNIPTLSISTTKHFLKSSIKNSLLQWESQEKLPENDRRYVKKQTFHLIGPAGVGKTDICKQLATELSDETGKPFKIRSITSPFYSRDDFIIPFPVMDKNNSLCGRFKMLFSDFVPEDSEEYGIFVIDEFSRGDKQLQQLFWQVLNEQTMHTYKFPKGWWVVSIDNPDEMVYETETMEDAAGLRRALHIYIEPSTSDFITYARKNKFHSLIIGFIEAYPAYLYDFDSQKRGSVYANPASWAKLSDILISADANGKVRNNLDMIETMAGGLLNVSMTRIFMNYVAEQKIISPNDIFFDYNTVRKEILVMKEKNDNAKLGEIMTNFMHFLFDVRPEYKPKQLKNCAQFLLDLPPDTAAIFATEAFSLEYSSEEFSYIAKLNSVLSQESEDYREIFTKNLIEMQNKKIKETS